MGKGLGVGGEEVVDLLLEGCGLGAFCGIAWAIDVLEEPLCVLEGMEDAFMMDGVGEDLGNDRGRSPGADR